MATATQLFAAEVVALRKRVDALGRTPQLIYSSVDNGAIAVKGPDGNLTGLIGLQWDGTTDFSVLAGPTPPRPNAPVTASVTGGVQITWDGTFQDPQQGFTSPVVAPMDFEGVNVYVSSDANDGGSPASYRKRMDSAAGGQVEVMVPGGTTVYVWLRTASSAGKVSEASVPAGPTNAGYIVGTDILDATVTAAKLAAGAVDTRALAASVVDVTKLADNAVTNVKLGNGAVTGLKIQDFAVNTTQLADSAVSSTKIASLAVGTAAIQDSAITNAKINNLAVNTAKIADLAVSTGKIDNLAVGTGQIANLAVASGKIADLAVVTAKINDLAVASGKIADLAVNTAKIGDLAVVTAKIGDLAVNNAKVGDLSVAKLTAGTMTADVTISGRYATALSGARVELNSQGLQKWDGSGNLMVSITGAVNFLTGTFRTALVGRRTELTATGSGSILNFYSPDNDIGSVESYSESTNTESIRIGVLPYSNGNSWNYLWNKLNINANAVALTEYTTLRSGTIELMFDKSAPNNGRFVIYSTTNKAKTGSVSTQRLYIDSTNISYSDGGGQERLKIIDGSDFNYWDGGGRRRFYISDALGYRDGGDKLRFEITANFAFWDAAATPRLRLWITPNNYLYTDGTNRARLQIADSGNFTYWDGGGRGRLDIGTDIQFWDNGPTLRMSIADTRYYLADSAGRIRLDIQENANGISMNSANGNPRVRVAGDINFYKNDGSTEIARFNDSNGSSQFTPAGSNAERISVETSGSLTQAPKLSWWTPQGLGLLTKVFSDSTSSRLEIRTRGDSAWEPIWASAFTVNSDERRKTDITPLNLKAPADDMLSKVTGITVKRFRRDHPDGQRPVELGFTAQDMPDDVVLGRGDGDEMIDVMPTIAMLTAAVQQLAAQVADLRRGKS